MYILCAQVDVTHCLGLVTSSVSFFSQLALFFFVASPVMCNLDSSHPLISFLLTIHLKRAESFMHTQKRLLAQRRHQKHNENIKIISKSLLTRTEGMGEVFITINNEKMAHVSSSMQWMWWKFMASLSPFAKAHIHEWFWHSMIAFYVFSVFSTSKVSNSISCRFVLIGKCSEQFNRVITLKCQAEQRNIQIFQLVIKLRTCNNLNWLLTWCYSLGRKLKPLSAIENWKIAFSTSPLLSFHFIRIRKNYVTVKTNENNKFSWFP